MIALKKRLKTEVKLTAEGKRHLGAFIGIAAYKETLHESERYTQLLWEDSKEGLFVS